MGVHLFLVLINTVLNSIMHGRLTRVGSISWNPYGYNCVHVSLFVSRPRKHPEPVCRVKSIWIQLRSRFPICLEAAETSGTCLSGKKYLETVLNEIIKNNATFMETVLNEIIKNNATFIYFPKYL
jgi:hypothetical protein